MKNGFVKLSFLTSFLLFSELLAAQNAGDDGSRLFITILTIVVVAIAFVVIVQVADNLMRIEAKKTGADTSGKNFSIFPGLKEFFAPKLPKFVDESRTHVLTKGHDIFLEGEAELIISESKITRYAMQPPNFIGISPIPKLMVEVGDSVKAGDPVFFDKKAPSIKHCAPVSGEVIAVNRGEKRSIAEVVILADKEMDYRKYDSLDLESASREDLVNYLLESGVWPFIRQRPYNVMADPSEVPANIFVSTFDTAPLAPDLNFVVQGNEAAFQKGLDVLRMLTLGHVHLGLDANGDTAPSAAFTDAVGVEKHWFHGKHPAGNVGVQIHHIAPVNLTDKAWTMDVQGVITLGKLFSEGKFDASRVVAITGDELNNPSYVKTYVGANITEMLAGNISAGENRVISGDVLSGEQKGNDSYLNIFDDQITVITEGDYYEMFGWLIPQKATPSISGTFPSFGDVKYTADTNTHGEKRAFVVTGQYESVMPMDIYVQHLMKNILINDFERMEGLGIYELVEEDVALCEFTCTSKQPLQQILRKGLDMMREEG
jgi:Na+-transporting NADH:ubiquinone oxidoreductase subunit A